MNCDLCKTEASMLHRIGVNGKVCDGCIRERDAVLEERIRSVRVQEEYETMERRENEATFQMAGYDLKAILDVLDAMSLKGRYSIDDGGGGYVSSRRTYLCGGCRARHSEDTRPTWEPRKVIPVDEAFVHEPDCTHILGIKYGRIIRDMLSKVHGEK
jgi:hypothetical protein